MAEYDGSIRIGVKLQLADAEKQFQHLKDSMIQQTKEVDKQSQAVQRLKEQYDKITSAPIDTKGIEKLEKDLLKAQERAAKLEADLENVKSFAAFELSEGSIAPETAAQLRELAEQLRQIDVEAGTITEKLQELRLGPAASSEARDLAASITEAESRLTELQSGAAKTKHEMNATGAEVERLNEYFQKMRDSATVADEGILKLQDELRTLQARKADLETAGVGLGYQEYDQTVARIREINAELSNYRNNLGSTQETAKSLERYEELQNRLAELQEKRSGLGLAIGAKEEYDRLSGKIASVNQELEECRANMNEDAAAAVRLQEIANNATVSDKRIVGLNEELEALKLRLSELDRAGVGVGFKEYDQTFSRIQQINRELSEYRNRLIEADQAQNGGNLSWWKKVSDMASRMRKTVTGAASAAGKAVSSLKSRIAGLGREKGMDKTSNAATRLLGRLKRLIVGAFFFNLIRRQLRAIVTGIGRYLTANEQFARALSGIKSNLLTAFQPVYDNVMPALSAMMEALENVTARFASFMATVFGTTAEQAQKNAEALYEQANATEETGKAAKKAQKFLASFDTIEKIGDKDSESDKKKTAPFFDTEFDKVKAPQWLLDFWKVFQDGWEQYGEPVMEAFKSAIGTIGDLIRAIGALFMSIWTGGAGLEFLGNIAGLLEMVLGIIHDIAAAFIAAWNNTYGQAVIEALSYALNSVLALLASIGAAFRAAWNDGSGEQICATILSILTNIFNIVGNLANRLREAWEANGNGVAIWNVILDLLQDVLTFLDKITAATAAWTEGLDLEPIVSGFLQLLEAVEPLVNLLLEGMAWAWENIMLPLAGWTIEEGVPVVLEALAKAFELLTSVLRALEPILKPVVALLVMATPIGMTIAAVKALGAALDWLRPRWEAIQTTVESVCNAIRDFLQGIVDMVKTVASAISSLFSSGAASGLAGGVTQGTSRSAASTYYIPRSYAYDSAAVADAFPHLAGGAVIAPNHEFLAVLGDQKSGTNIETPLSTMKQAFLEAIAESGITRQSGGGVAELTLDGQKFARLIFPYTQGERSRRGVNLVMGGA